LPDGGEKARFAHTNTIFAAAISPDGKLVASAGGDNQDIWLWNPQTAKPVGHIIGRGQCVYAVAFSPDGRTLAFGNHPHGQLLPPVEPLERAFDLFSVNLAPEGIIKSEKNWLRGQTAIPERRVSAALLKDDKGLSIRVGDREVAKVHGGTIYSCAFTPDGSQLVVGGNLGALTLRDVKTGNLVRRFVGHAGPIFSVAISPDGRLLASGSDDQTIRLWNIQTGELLLTIFVSADNEWVAWCPSGYYKSSSNGDKLIGWHLNRGIDQPAGFLYAWQLRRRFERPEMIERVPETGSVAEAQRLYHQLHAKSDPAIADNLVPPTVVIQSPSDGTRVGMPTIHLKATATPNPASDEPIKELRILVNGRPVAGQKTITIVGTPRSAATIDRKIDLVEGDNEITVLAITESATSTPVSVHVFCIAKGAKPDPYVLAVGISQYKEKAIDLQFADKDATGLAEAFARQEGKLFGKVHERVLTNEQATRREVLRGFKWLLDGITQRNMAVVVISGHGERDPKTGAYYVVPYDAEVNDLEATCVAWSQVKETLENLPCKVVMALDTCHSGAALGVAGRERYKDLTDVIKELSSIESGVVVMSSSTGREMSLKRPDWGHGAFALALIEAISGKRLYTGAAQTPLPGDERGVVSLTSLDNYITARVKELTGGAQHPVTDRGGIPSFPIAVVGGRAEH
jgi:WD40 repeat protein